jgi:NADH-quinone oxidoreductase subunit C
MEGLEQIKARIEAAIPGAIVEIVQNASPSQQHSLKIDNEHAHDVAKWLHDDLALRLDFCSNVRHVNAPRPQLDGERLRHAAHGKFCAAEGNSTTTPAN